MTEFVFGYGSLVNRATHGYAETATARIAGWRRAWRHVAAREVAFLTAVPDPASVIDGLIAGVLAEDWPALDQREFSYDRVRVDNVLHARAPVPVIHIYHAPPERQAPASELRPVLLSYLDVVVQGYLREFGEAGVAGFFDTTDGWDAPILDDRAAPRYSRYVPVSGIERDLADAHLARVGARKIASV